MDRILAGEASLRMSDGLPFDCPLQKAASSRKGGMVLAAIFRRMIFPLRIRGNSELIVDYN
jgi:hypothetical protein